MDQVAATLWYAVSVTVILLAWNASRRFFPGDGRALCAMHATTLSWTAIAIVSCVLGAFGILNSITLGCGVLSSVFGCWLWSRKQPGVDSDLSEPAERNGRLFPLFWHVVWCGIAALAVVRVVQLGLMKFPRDWDTLMYHRPLIDLWLQSGSLYVPECVAWHAPGNNEVIGLWWAAPFSGDFWVALMNFPAVLLLALGTYQLGKQLGLTPTIRHATVIAVLGSEVVFREITNAKNDIAIAGLFVTSIAYGTRCIDRKQWTSGVFCGAALGLLAGIKYYALGYAAVALAGLMVIAWSRQGRRFALILALGLIGLMSLPAAYWYGRNAVASGTPVFPLGYKGKNVSELNLRLQRSVWKQSFLGNGRHELFPQYVEAVWEEGGASQGAALMTLPTAFLWIIGSTILSNRRKDIGNTAKRLGFGVMVVGAWTIFVITPFTVNVEDEGLIRSSFLVVRFSQVPLLLTVFTLGLLISDTSKWIHGHCASRGSTYCRHASAVLPLLVTVATLIVFVQRTTARSDGRAALNVFIAIDCVLLSLVLRALSDDESVVGRTLRRTVVTAMLLGGMWLYCLSTSFLSTWWHGGFAKYYDQRFGTQAYTHLEARSGPQPSVTALPFRYYPFFGSRRQFRVHRPLRAMTPRFLLEYLDSNSIDVLVLARRGNQFELYTSERIGQWMEENPGVFHKVESGNHFDVYQIEKQQLRMYVKSVNSSHPDISGRAAGGSSGRVLHMTTVEGEALHK